MGATRRCVSGAADPHISHPQIARRANLPQGAVLLFRQIGRILSVIPPQPGGAHRDRHDVRGGDAVDVAALTDERASHGRAKSCGPGAPKAGAKSGRGCGRIAAGEGGNRQGSPRRARISRKPLRREGRCDSACTCGFALSRNFFARRPMGACGHPVFPAPSVRWGRKRDAKTRAERAAGRMACAFFLLPLWEKVARTLVRDG